MKVVITKRDDSPLSKRQHLFYYKGKVGDFNTLIWTTEINEALDFVDVELAEALLKEESLLSEAEIQLI
jgi:hypothetical protein